MGVTILKGATIDDQAGGVARDVLVTDGTITEIGAVGAVAVPGGADTVELAGHVLLPAPVEPHAHLDKAFLAETVHNAAGDLLGAIEAMAGARARITYDDTVARAERAARLLAANGYVAVRTHADTTLENGLTSVTALAEVRDRVRGLIDIEIVALCGYGVVGPAGAGQRALLVDALQAGADVVGGCPHLEDFTPAGIAASTDVYLQIATDHGRPVDLHTDETLDPAANGLDVLARRVLEGFDLPATASHCVSLGQQPPATQQETAERVAAAGVGVIALPHTNLFLQGRGRAPMPRALTAVDVLRAAGATVAAGADNLQDPFNPVGRACAFETAGLMVMAAHLPPGDAWAAVSTQSARVLGRPSGIAVGSPADLLAVPAATAREAIAFAPARRLRWKSGSAT